MLIARSTKGRIYAFKDKIKALFDMIDLDLLKSYLRIQVKQIKGEITLTQSTLTMKILFDFNLHECNLPQTLLEVKQVYSQNDSKNQVDSSNYNSLMGLLRYLMHTRLDLMYCTWYLCRYMENHSMEHFGSAKRVLRYVKGTMNFGLRYKKGRDLSLVGYIDSDYGGDSDDRKSTYGTCFILGDNVVTWMS